MSLWTDQRTVPSRGRMISMARFRAHKRNPFVKCSVDSNFSSWLIAPVPPVARLAPASIESVMNFTAPSTSNRNSRDAVVPQVARNLTRFDSTGKSVENISKRRVAVYNEGAAAARLCFDSLVGHLESIVIIRAKRLHHDRIAQTSGNVGSSLCR